MNVLVYNYSEVQTYLKQMLNMPYTFTEQGEREGEKKC